MVHYETQIVSASVDNVLALYDAVEQMENKSVPLFTVQNIGVDEHGYTYIILKMDIPDIFPIIEDIVYMQNTEDLRIRMIDYSTETPLVMIQAYKQNGQKKIIDFLYNLNNKIINYIRQINIDYLLKYIDDNGRWLEDVANKIKKPKVEVPDFHPFNDTPFSKPIIRLRPYVTVTVKDASNNNKKTLNYTVESRININLSMFLKGKKKLLEKLSASKINDSKLKEISDRMYDESYKSVLFNDFTKKYSNIYKELFIRQINSKNNYLHKYSKHSEGYLFSKDDVGKIGYSYAITINDPDIERIKEYNLSSYINSDLKKIAQFVYNSIVLEYIVLGSYVNVLDIKTQQLYKDKINEFLSKFKTQKQKVKNINIAR